MWDGNGDQGLRLLRNLTPGSDYDIGSRLNPRYENECCFTIESALLA